MSCFMGCPLFRSSQLSPCGVSLELPGLPVFQEKLEMQGFSSSRHGTAETNLTSIHEDAGSMPVLAQWVWDLALP